jgi:hypothetical protein
LSNVSSVVKGLTAQSVVGSRGQTLKCCNWAFCGLSPLTDRGLLPSKYSRTKLATQIQLSPDDWVGCLFYDVLPVTRLYSVDGRVTSE